MMSCVCGILINFQRRDHKMMRNLLHERGTNMETEASYRSDLGSMLCLGPRAFVCRVVGGGVTGCWYSSQDG